MIPIRRFLRAAAGSDQDLLDRYVRNRDEQAFEALVRRYGTGVWAACVRLAGRDAEDAFQAVFLLLSRKAETVTGSLPAWLHTATRRVAATIRRADRRRATTERVAAHPDLASSPDPTLREGLALLDEELARLPERYRAVLVVCCLEGRSRDEAAAQLGWSEGQVKGRLERARELLRTRLARRGVALGALLLAAAVTGPTPARADPPPATAVTLTHGVIRAMAIQKLRLAATVLVACVGVTFLGGVALQAQPKAANAPKELPEQTADAARPQGKGELPPKGQIDEATRKEIEDLRKRIEALEKVRTPPAVETKKAEPQKVVLTTPQVRDVVVTHQYAGKIRAQHHIDVRALANGAVSEIPIKEGQAVKKGDVLFKVAPTLAQAKLDAEMAEVKIAKVELENTKKLFDDKVVGQQELALHEAKLTRAQAKAKLAEAEVGSTVVRAPFDGLIDRLQQQEGQAVKEGDTLTTLSDISTMWVYFDVPETRYLDYVNDRDRVKVGMPLELVLANGSKFSQIGKLGAVEGRFDDKTGAIPFRADFPNPDRLLRHGQTGAVLIHIPLKGATVIPQRAVVVGDYGIRYVYVVDKDDVVRKRGVITEDGPDGLFIVKDGVDVSDRIVLQGVQQVRSGEKVTGYEFRKPEDVIGNPKKALDK